MTENTQIVLQRSIFNRRWNNDGQARRPVANLLKKVMEGPQISKFKYEQGIFPDHSETRLINRACAECLPYHNAQIDEEVKMLGIKNLFRMATENPDKPLIVRLLSTWCHVWESVGLSAQKMRFLDKKEIIEDCIASLSENREEKLQVAQSLCVPFTGFWGTIFFLRILGWILRKAFVNIFDGISVHEGEIELLERAHQSGLPIIYIPLHRSYMDQFLIYFSLQSLGLKTPYFFSSSSLRFWGQFIGGFEFAQPNLDEKLKTARSLLGASVFQTLLKKRSSICLSLEKMRSRSGKPSTEIYGVEFLTMMYDSWQENEIEDAFIVPVSVSYEYVPEHLQDSPFSKETSRFSMLKNLIQLLKRRMGFARVGFGQPFTLREFQVSVKDNFKIKSIKKLWVQDRISFESYSTTYLSSELCWNSHSLKRGLSSSLSSLYNFPALVEDNVERLTFVDSLALNSIYASSKSTTVMPTHLVAFLLLKKFRKGVGLDKLVVAMKELLKWFKMYEKDIGYSGDVAEAVLHAIEVLGNDLVKVKSLPIFGIDILRTKNAVYIEPMLNPYSLERLGYYSNMVMPFVALESIVAAAVFSIVGNNMASALDFQYADLQICDDELTRETHKLYEIFSSEFFLHSPCITGNVAIRRAFDILSDKNLMENLIDESKQSKRKAFGNIWEEDNYSDDEEEASGFATGAGGDAVFVHHLYKVINTKESHNTLSFLRSLIVPYLEIYAAIALELISLIPGDSEKQEQLYDYQFIEIILESFKNKFSQKEFGELLTFDTVKSALLAFEIHSFVELKTDEVTRLKIMQITSSKKQLEDVSNNILHFVTF